MDIGEKVIDAIIQGRLISAVCPDSPESSVLFVWSANAPEQLAMMFREHESRRLRDIESIRFAMKQAIESFRKFSTVACQSDESVLTGMQSMIDVFEAEVLMCESR